MRVDLIKKTEGIKEYEYQLLTKGHLESIKLNDALQAAPENIIEFRVVDFFTIHITPDPTDEVKDEYEKIYMKSENGRFYDTSSKAVMDTLSDMFDLLQQSEDLVCKFYKKKSKKNSAFSYIAMTITE